MTTYIGSSSLLPEEHRALCSCAGLFYCRVIAHCGDMARVEIAALSHYFDADVCTRKTHVRSIFLSQENMAQLVEWDRRLAGLATCDVREMVEEQTRSNRVETPVARRRFEPEPEMLEARREPVATVYVEQKTVVAVMDEMQVRGSKERIMHTVILRAILATLDRQIERCQSQQRHNSLLWQRDQVESVMRWRRLKQAKGCGWYRVLGIEQLGYGWEISVVRPVSLVA